jgi:hypothetical protein
MATAKTANDETFYRVTNRDIMNAVTSLEQKVGIISYGVTFGGAVLAVVVTLLLAHLTGIRV